MADDADDAQHYIDMKLAADLAAWRNKVPKTLTAHECISCGEEIPVARRQAVTTTQCQNCAAERERRTR